MKSLLVLLGIASVCVGDTLIVDQVVLPTTTTIQAAIDKAKSGDVIVVRKGTYKGKGNYNIDFKGKSITLKGEDPTNTIIDAQGGKVVFSFKNNEKNTCVADGFTLKAGDTTKAVRGVKGYYEFLGKACPTIKNIHVLSSPISRKMDNTLKIFQQGSGVSRVWNGVDPFHQPTGTTNYWGSGDVNNDGVVNATDATAIHNMIIHTTAMSPRADINGDGTVTSADSILLRGYINSGTALPGWWNSLTISTTRNSWIDQVMARDKTQNYIWTDYFQCGMFSNQLFISATGYRDDLYQTLNNGGPTAFNVPMYHVNVASSTFGHAINAILVGDSANKGADWRFVEPQTDATIHPGDWDMPYGVQLYIYPPAAINSQGDWGNGMGVTFNVLSDGTFQFVSNTGILATHGAPAVLPVDNRVDYWNPAVLGIGNGKLLFEQTNDDTNHFTNIMLSSLPYTDPIANSSNLITFHKGMHILDAKKAPDGNIRVLWKTNTTSTPQVYYGVLDTVNKVINPITLLTTAPALGVTEGRLLIQANNNIKAFWIQSAQNVSASIYWSVYNGSTWTAAASIASFHSVTDPISNNHEWKRYMFDVATITGTNIMLMYVDQDPNYLTWALRYMKYVTSWSAAITIDSATIMGCQLASTSTGKVHAVYNTGNLNYGWSASCERGNILYRWYSGTSWTSSNIIDNSGQASGARILSANDSIYAIWEKTPEGLNTIPVLARLSNSTWTTRTLVPDTGTSTWYPMLSYNTGTGHLVAAWSARKANRVGVGIYDTLLTMTPPCTNVSISTQPSNISVTVGSTATFTVGASGTVPQYQWQKSTNAGGNYFIVSGATASNYTTEATTTSMNQYRYRCYVSNTCPSNTVSNGAILTVITPVLTLGQAVDKPNLTWTTGAGDPADSVWFPETSVFYYGGSAAQSGHVVNDCGHRSWIQTTVTGPDTVRFYWKVSSEPNADYLRFYIGSTKKAQISGNVNWQSKKFYVSAGVKVLKWQYETDCGDAVGSDCGWLDKVRLDNQ